MRTPFLELHSCGNPINKVLLPNIEDIHSREHWVGMFHKFHFILSLRIISYDHDCVVSCVIKFSKSPAAVLNWKYIFLLHLSYQCQISELMNVNFSLSEALLY